MTTWREYMANHDTKHFSWCIPYSTPGGEYVIVQHDGDISAISTPDTVAYRYDGGITDDVLEQIARAIVPDYGMYSGYSDTDLLLMHLRPTGCAACPFNSECSAMDADMDDDDNT